ncbi:transglycosylase domain-containing protein [Thalassobacter stenotrophicus]|uniref:transglycosylase domain-containing protein n=1 Tax=Thalassobacter stenotrophicus TaxID=266809 RepID=UPI000D5ED091|nr:transglycosylase domain-containing protein [Thalassobacter stenotrophicus]PVZ49384.1 hypothetical protein DD557_11920 [Thalassobacter stenotrophicus]
MTIFRGIISTIVATAVITVGALAWYTNQPPELGRLAAASGVLRSSDGRIINLTLTDKGFWREPVRIEEIDPRLVEVLIAYEDQRYWQHSGIDLRAAARAGINLIKYGKVTSGASTITMQTVRLLNTSLGKRTFTTKLRQMVEAIRLERHWTKDKILEAYFTLAPYGGNIEGVKAATDAWFQKSPANLTLNEIALLVALPQSPERRRPDRFPHAAYEAKQVVLDKVAPRLNFAPNTLAEVASEPLPSRLSKPSSHAIHLAERLNHAGHRSINTTLNSDWQRQVENILAADIETRPAPIQAAALIVERKTGLVRAYVGSAGYSSTLRKGAINYLTSLRSPGSTLKPLIYGKALNRGLIQFDEVFDDSTYFRAGYQPTNFDQGFSGKVGLRNALITSLNIPAIRVLEKIDPNLLQSELNSYLDGALSTQQDAGLSLGVGGLYLTPEQLVSVYLGVLDPRHARALTFEVEELPRTEMTLVSQSTADQLLDLLIQEMSNGERVAFKTGTSYARQDAWSVQIYENHLILVWMGTPDNEPTSTLTGAGSAFPISLEIGRSLGFKPPSKPVLQPRDAFEVMPAKVACHDLINYPQNGSWIRSTSRVLKIIGDQEADWYLNGKPLGRFRSQIDVPQAGVNTLTARKGSCSQTNEVFLEQ